MKNHFSKQPRKIKFYGLQSSGCCFLPFLFNALRVVDIVQMRMDPVPIRTQSCCFHSNLIFALRSALFGGSFLISPPSFRTRLDRCERKKTKCKNKLHGNLDRMHDNNLLHSNDLMPCVDITMRFHFSVSNTNAPPPPSVDTIESCLILNFCDECTRISLNGVQVVL